VRTKSLLVELLVAGAFQSGIVTLAAAQTRDTLAWSPTTYEAATSPENHRMLARGRRRRITGEVVDVSCYVQFGKHGTAHALCAAACALHGQPIGLLTVNRTLYTLFPEDHLARRDGKADITVAFIPLIGQTVTLMGTATSLHGAHELFLKKADLEGMKVVEAGAAPGAGPTHH